MKYTIFLHILFTSVFAHSMPDYLKDYPDVVTPTKKTKIIAVIDSGFDFKSRWHKIHNKKKNEDGLPILRPKLCNKGHKDFTNTNMEDENGHGTHIAGLISTNIGTSIDYCIVIIKIFSKKGEKYADSVTSNAILHAVSLGANIINMSFVGKAFVRSEYYAAKKALDKGVVLVAAAGNDSKFLDNVVISEKNGKPTYLNKYNGTITTKNVEKYFPANLDSRIIVVGSTDRKTNKYHPFSNRGATITFSADGNNSISLWPQDRAAKYTGTSMSAAKITGILVKKWGNN